MSDDIPYLIKSVSDKMRASGDAQLRQRGLTFSQLRVLGFLHDCGGSATQKEIERHLGAAHPTVVGLVGRMEKRGFVTHYTDDQDRRNKIVCITEKAELLGDELEKGRQQSFREMTSGLTEQERAELVRLLQILNSSTK